MKKKKDYYEPGEVPEEAIQRMKDEKEAEEYLKANPDVTPAPRAYKNNEEYLKENEANKERMKRAKRYSDTIKELQNPKGK